MDGIWTENDSTFTRYYEYKKKYPRCMSAPLKFICSLDHPDAWEPLVVEILEFLEKINLTLEDHWIQVAQTKEKFGELRFYIDTCPTDRYDEIWGFIDKVTAKSRTMCIICGKEGKMNTKGWWSPYCKEHFPKEKQ